VIRGRVTPEREAIVHLIVHGASGQEEIEAVIDTGFNDSLTLPPTTIAALDLPFAAPVQGMLADGSIITMHYHLARVDWNGALRRILVLAADGGALVGMSLLYGYDLFIETIDGGDVTITERA
jgi:clan AA aspartic protease